ncbi:MAG: hypothetical protein IKJ01_00855, partial [Lachnospiraceae bacterium]|nr:hypothetical protein [Lachnospiraceae bacterium]
SLNGSEEIAYTDAINGGNIALEQGFISKNETTGKIDYKKYWKSYELCYAVHYAENHMPEDLYKAMVIAERHNLIADISNNECKWNEPLTKQMALSLLTNVYLDLGTVVNVEHGYIENYVNKNYPYSEEITERMTKNNLKWYEGTNEGKKIDILKVSKEALALYDILLEGADNDGIDDILIEDVYFEQEVIPVMTIEGELISGTYQKQLEAVHEELAEYANACYQVYNTFLDDHLEVFWLYSGGVTYQIKEINKEKYQAEILLRLRMTNSDTGEVVMSARMKEYQSEERIKEDIAIRDARIAEILKAVEGKSDYEKLLYFYKELTMTNQYNTNLNLPAGGIPRISICAIKGSVGEEGPVCASYAKAYKVLCDAAGIPCIDVGGYLRESSFGLYTDPHQWNYVKLEDKWYLVDATWGDPYDSKVGNPISGYENEEWFLVGSNTIRNGIPVGATRPLSPLLVNTPILSEEEYQPKETEMEKK